jgi:hypothetical protein
VTRMSLAHRTRRLRPKGLGLSWGGPCEDDAIRGNAPFGGVSADHFHRLNAVGDAVLAILGDQSMVVQLRHEGRTCGFAWLCGVLTFNLLGTVFQDYRHKPTGDEPLRDIVTLGVD